MNFLPAFYFPTSLVCVDDKQSILDGYQKLFTNSYDCAFYQDSKSVEEFFINYESPLSKINFINKISEFEDNTFNTKLAIKLDISKIMNLAIDQSKYSEIAVLLADYYMLPGIDGLELCKNLKKHKFKKMLLTESQNYSIARDALNSGVIDFFANKTDSSEQIKEVIHHLVVNYFCDLTADFRKYLSTEHGSPMTDKAFINYFIDIVNKNSIIEYYLIDTNGSYLLIAPDKKKHILIVHNSQSLLEFSSILNEYEELKSEAQSIIERKLIPFLGIGKEISNTNLVNINNYLFTSSTLEGNQQYFTHLLKDINIENF